MYKLFDENRFWPPVAFRVSVFFQFGQFFLNVNIGFWFIMYFSRNKFDHSIKVRLCERASFEAGIWKLPVFSEIGTILKSTLTLACFEAIYMETT